MRSKEPEQPQVASFVTSDAGAGRILRVIGEVDISTTPSFKNALDSALSGYSGDLTLDLTDVEFMDSSGLHALMETTRQVISRGGSMRLRNPGHTVYRLLEISGLLGYFHITS